jgi:hypothetical protein
MVWSNSKDLLLSLSHEKETLTWYVSYHHMIERVIFYIALSKRVSLNFVGRDQCVPFP